MADLIQTLPNTKNAVIVPLVQKSLLEEAKLFNTVTNASMYASKGAVSVSVPRFSDFTVVERVLGAPADAAKLTDAKDLISLNKIGYIAWLEDSSDIYQSTIEYRIEASMRAAKAQAKFVDQTIVTALNTVASLSVDGAVPAAITEAKILAMREHIISKGGDIENCTLAIGLGVEKDMLQIANFIDASKYGNGNIENGVIGKVFGVKVMVSRLITSTQAYLYDKEGLAIAMQREMDMSEQPANEYGPKSVRVATEAVFGVGGLHMTESAGAASALVAKLHD